MKLVKNCMALGLATSLLMASASVVCAEDTVLSNSGGTAQVLVTVNIPSTFSVTVPKSIALSESGVFSEECVSVTADLAGTKQIDVTVPNAVTLSSSGKTNITGDVSLSKTTFTSAELAGGAAQKATLEVDASEHISAGEWNGSFNVTVAVNDTP